MDAYLKTEKLTISKIRFVFIHLKKNQKTKTTIKNNGFPS